MRFLCFSISDFKQLHKFCVVAMPRKRSASTKRPGESKRSRVEKNVEDDNGNSLDAGDKVEYNSNKENILNINQKTKDGKDCNLKIVSWNVAGVRAWTKKDGHKWLIDQSPDIVCLQETKCSVADIPQILKDMKEYEMFWNETKAAKGLSGVALLSKVKPVKISYGIGVEEHDQEGRTITAEYESYYLVNTYVPNSQRGLKRLEYRMKWNEDFMKYIKSLDAVKPVVLCGDMNVSHLEIDLANPKQNRRNAGFTQEERDGMSDLLECGFIDTYRHLYPDLTKKYTFWTYMGKARDRNVGWRLDYFIISQRWIDNLCDNVIVSDVMGSDHCPIELYFALPSSN